MAASGAKGGPLLILLLILCGALGWNYTRNADAESVESRPYRSYSDTELEQLKSAQESEAKRRDAIYRKGVRKVTVRDRSLLGDRVDEFERVRSISAQQRALVNDVAESQASIALIETEQAVREKNRPIYKMILRRTFTFRPI
jgi:hypothetical protein